MWSLGYSTVHTGCTYWLQQWSYLICSAEPPEVALVMAQAASFLVRNSATCRIVMRGGSRPASITIYREGKQDMIKWGNAFKLLWDRRLFFGSQRWHPHTHLYLCSVPCSNVGDSPAGFLLDGLLRATQEVKKGLQCWTVQNHLGNRANYTQSQ